ncbi:hypothetical protein FMM05_13380 [Flavobacterium zepuense]|uniref:Conjugal transfer protein TraD n=1 Tax=Flavobacterium zepuense TaxID=2593302 RepID=A0A552UZJ3_9FLAO|nr:hypothetical protein [Flavobacterium zepuense]TRW23647.1 hypothetical protein FMM05_13380 [Flavobacterium zepuense]
METIIICLLVLAVALLLYVITQGKKDKDNVQQKEDPLAGLPDIIGRPRNTPSYSSLGTIAQVRTENDISITDSSDNRNEGTARVSEIPQKESDDAEGLPDLAVEEEDMRNYAASGTEDGFATGITFDELAIVQEMLARKALAPSEEKTAAALASKIDGTELLGLIESKIGDASKRIAMLLDSGITQQHGKSPSFLRNDKEDGFNVGDYI